MAEQKTLESKSVSKLKSFIKDYATGKTLIEGPEEIEARQVFERRLVEEYGYSKSEVEINYEIQKGSQKIGPADIVVFRNALKNPDNLYIIVETKRMSRKDGIEQLKSYLAPSTATFGIWFNGKETEYLIKLDKAPYFKSIRNIQEKMNA
jgi:type I restriction enzyme M protein